MELRRFKRAPFRQPVRFVVKGNAPKGRPQFSEGVAIDISLGGMFIASDLPAAFGAEITVHITRAGTPDELVVPATVRWTRPDGMGVQFGLLGAKETFVITEIVRQGEESG